MTQGINSTSPRGSPNAATPKAAERSCCSATAIMNGVSRAFEILATPIVFVVNLILSCRQSEFDDCNAFYENFRPEHPKARTVEQIGRNLAADQAGVEKRAHHGLTLAAFVVTYKAEFLNMVKILKSNPNKKMSNEFVIALRKFPEDFQNEWVKFYRENFIAKGNSIPTYKTLLPFFEKLLPVLETHQVPNN